MMAAFAAQVCADPDYLAGALAWSGLGAIAGTVIGWTANTIWTRRTQ